MPSHRHALPPMQAPDDDVDLPPLRALFPDLLNREPSGGPVRRASFAAPVASVPIVGPMRQRSRTEVFPRTEVPEHPSRNYLPPPMGMSMSASRSPRAHPYGLPQRSYTPATPLPPPPPPPVSYAPSLSPAVWPSEDPDMDDDAMDIDDASDGGSDPERRHACERCGKRFNRPSSLRTHLHTHDGSKPYECPFPGCGRSFNVNSNMRRHYRTHGPHPTRAGARPHGDSASPPLTASMPGSPGRASGSSGSDASSPDRTRSGRGVLPPGPHNVDGRGLRPLFAYAPRRPPGPAAPSTPPAPRSVPLSAVLTAAMG